MGKRRGIRAESKERGKDTHIGSRTTEPEDKHERDIKH